MYIHNIHGGNGGQDTVNLVEFAEFCGLEVGRDVLFADQYHYMLGYPDEQVNLLYNAMDVHTLVTMGEGFGIPIIEAQSAGTPVIVGDWTAMSELCMAGWKVDKRESEPFYTPLGAHQRIPHIGAIADRLEQAYKKRDNTYMREKARKLAMEYDADKVTAEYWKPCLDEIASKLPEQEADTGAGLREGEG
jgi:glycosyltransferase involved in cell wall biosynthesis